MYKTISLRIFLIIVLAACALAAVPQPAEASTLEDMSPIHLQFGKQGGANGIWNGSVSGDVDGNLTSQLLSLTPAGPIWKVRFAWIVSAGEQSFTAVLQGTLNTMTGQVVMNGPIVEGWLVGAQVHEEGQLVDPSIGRFQGTINIFPATAN
jgi:hypothetical protein